MSEELTPENLIKAWQFQDQVSDMALKILTAGIELGAKAMSVELLKAYFQSVSQDAPLEPEAFQEAEKKAIEIATKKIAEGMNNARGA
jgi:hypothetical protein